MDVTELSLSGAAGLYAVKLMAEWAAPPWRKWRNGKNGNGQSEEPSSLSALHRQIRHGNESSRLADSQIAEALKYHTDVLKELVIDIKEDRKASAAESLRTQETLMELRIELAKAVK